jgi:parvulin-like peptidyl-prolyl isomerase
MRGAAMAQRSFSWVELVCGVMLLVSLGCASSRTAGVQFAARPESAVSDEDPMLSPSVPANFNRVTRGQRPEPQGPVRQTSLDTRDPETPVLGKLRVSVRAWVNEKPIFDEEVRNACYPYLMDIARLPEPQRSAKQVEIFKRELDNLIDKEIIVQEIHKKLEKNPKMLDKLTKSGDKDFEKQVLSMKKRAGVKTDEELKDLMVHQGTSLEAIRKQFMRTFLSTEYMKSRLWEEVQKIGHLEVEEYYKNHLNEFQTVDNVKWQDVFIAVGPKHRTVEDARRFAEQLVARLKQGEDFKKLIEFDDGDSRYRGGEGYGKRRGEIKPAELEPYLFRMHDGDIGPIVPLSTGVHVFRLEKREYAGQMPFDQKVQVTIANKLKNERAERKSKEILEELRSKAIIEIVRDTSK